MVVADPTGLYRVKYQVLRWPEGAVTEEHVEVTAAAAAVFGAGVTENAAKNAP